MIDLNRFVQSTRTALSSVAIIPYSAIHCFAVPQILCKNKIYKDRLKTLYNVFEPDQKDSCKYED